MHESMGRARSARYKNIFKENQKLFLEKKSLETLSIFHFGQK